MTEVQKAILVGMTLGDAFLQSTGRKNARIRLEHSVKQYDYLVWKISFFPEYFKGKPAIIDRTNPRYGKTYSYCRFQSIASPEIGDFRRIFYDDSNKKVIPQNIGDIFVDPLSLAIWFMDDGYYYKRDKMSYIYLANHTNKEFDFLDACLRQNFDLHPRLKHKKLGWCFLFSVEQTQKLVNLISGFVPDCMKYKVGL